MTKQQILDQITTMVSDDESVSDLTALVSGYPDELDDAMVDELATKVDEYVADNTLLEKAYADLAEGVEAAADEIAYGAESAVQSVAQRAHSDIAFAQGLLDEE